MSAPSACTCGCGCEHCRKPNRVEELLLAEGRQLQKIMFLCWDKWPEIRHGGILGGEGFRDPQLQRLYDAVCGL